MTPDELEGASQRVLRRIRRRLAKVLRAAPQRGRLWRDSRATAVIEFAFALPILCTMVFSLYEVTEGVICYMKVSDVANTIGDLIGQTTRAQGGVGNTDFDNLYIAAQLVMSNTTGGGLGFSIANVYYDVNGNNPTESWHVERGNASAVNNATSFVSGLGTAHGSTLVIKVTYTYTSLLDYFIKTPIVISTEVAAQPRNLLPVYSYNQGTPCPPASGSQTCS
jgi:Flp pilus assembly protein TadG